MKPYYEDVDSGITIYHGNCLEIDAWLDADVLVTDPPYGIGWSRSANPARRSKAHAGIVNDQNTGYRDEALLRWGEKPAVVFGSFYAPFPAMLRQVLVWSKPADAGVVGSVTGYRRDCEPIFLVGDWPKLTVQWSSVIRSHQQSISSVVGETGHPHTKPVDMMRLLLDRCPARTVADPFMGSGTTLRAAKDLGRRAIGIEIEERHCETAVRRLGQGVLDFEAMA